ncbi:MULTISPECIES: BglG family transcription antiterminator [Clostridium]|uniref:BglG family transcription antiterminator n=1 Tax=Clostridium TaxID=1485 RepID=UPI00163D958B|nr:BglG family transcription antiterminator [Clostridium sp.]MBS4958847.1 transcription antiterminator [Clostridium sp.]MDU2155978.1 BglG family transcription antiterminator [Clostridium sp.]MDU3349528.1 BglG family transcription antiterminator [Clostridium sp.]MDU3408179.1 BglG family transcription antiterminator [Clostridium sp.]MDU3547912.1 BglG family transcription antiterminator [Clostridium sp.]
MLNSRCMQILNKIIENNEFVKISTLSKIFNVSPRTIRNDLIKIEDYLIDNGFTLLIRDYKNGVKVNQASKLKNLINNFNNSIDANQIIYTKEDIKKFIVLKLLIEKEPVKQKYFEELFQVSRTTIFNSINEIDDILDNKSLRVERIPKLGFCIKSDIVSKVNEFSMQIINNFNIAKFYNYINFEEVSPGINSFYLENLIDKNLYYFLKSKIIKIESMLNKTFDDGSFIRIVLFLDKMINHKVESNIIYYKDKKLVSTKEYTVANEIILELLEEKFSFEISQNLIYGLTILLLTSKGTNKNNKNNVSPDFVNKLISSVEKELSIKIIDKEKLANSLTLHIEPMIFRLKAGIMTQNPLFLQIKTDYKEIFRAVEKACSIFEEEFSITVNEQEVSYMTIYFASVLENENNKYIKKNKVAVVCVEGLAISKNLSISLKNLFDVEVTAEMSVRNLNEKIIAENDYIISTIDVPNIGSKLIKVSNDLNQDDIKILSEKFSKKVNTNIDLVKIERIMNSIKKWCDVKDLESLQYEVFQAMLEKPKTIEAEVETKIMNFSRELIEICSDVISWEDAVKKSGNLLIKKNYIKESYIDRIIQNINEFGGYMIISPRVMLAHAGIEDGVNENSISILSLKNGFELKNQFDLPINLVITMAVTDEKSHLKFLKELVEFMNDKNNTKRLLEIDNVNGIYTMFKNNIKF